uniref:hepatic lectin-like n=1 Tax=Styela clava TaxID=7725 RepID=UPI00193AAD51|nr:hepatic lectin-like [Styela clava]
MEMECYANVENIYETGQTTSRPPSIPKQDNNKATNKKTIFVVAVSFGICFIVSAAVFVLLIMQLQNKMEHITEKLDKMSEIDSSLASNINDTHKPSSSIKDELRKIKNEVRHLDSKILTGDNELKANLTEANLRMNKMFSISGWFRASNNLIYKRFTDSVNYATAKAQCEGMGARLVSTGIRNNKVKSEIFPKHYLTGAFAWIGLDDISKEGSWVWSDGVNISPSKIWAPGEPTGGLNEDCAHMILLNSKLDVYDGGCTGPHRFVCESDSA